MASVSVRMLNIELVARLMSAQPCMYQKCGSSAGEKMEASVTVCVSISITGVMYVFISMSIPICALSGICTYIVNVRGALCNYV